MVIFITVPIVLYMLFRAADADKQKMLFSSVEERGRLIGEILRPHLAHGGIENFSAVAGQFHTLAGPDAQLKLLFRPNSENKGADNEGSGFFYVAAAPEVAAAALAAEQRRLQKLGVLDVLSASCNTGKTNTLRYLDENTHVEVVTAITPLLTGGGCWVVVTAYSTAGYQRSSIGRPYWTTPEVRISAIIYATMALITITILLGAWSNLRRISLLARKFRVDGRQGRLFAQRNALTEITQVTDELDRLVLALEQSARSIREAAEDNTHAFKTPLAVISQSVEPLKRIVPPGNERGQRAVSMIEGAIAKLDDLIASAWRMDELIADLIDPPREIVDLTSLLNAVLTGYATVLRERGLNLRLEIAPDIEVRASEEMLETIIENLMENAASFSQPGTSLHISLSGQKSLIMLKIEDEGPGVPEGELEKIFERYYSRRHAEDEAEQSRHNEAHHLGIGLWIVRRNIEAIGGRIWAENRAEGGLRMSIELPRASL